MSVETSFTGAGTLAILKLVGTVEVMLIASTIGALISG
jgi:hypothetical protein